MRVVGCDMKDESTFILCIVETGYESGLRRSYSS